MLEQFLFQDSGESTLEYGLIAVIISIIAIVAMKLVGSELSTTFSYVGSELHAE